MKCLVVGDIHGCLAEFQDLLRAAGLGPVDVVIALGDIVDRGPDSVKVFEFFRDRGPDPVRTAEALRLPPEEVLAALAALPRRVMDGPMVISLLGNHERKHVRSFQGKIPPAFSQRVTREQFGPQDRYREAVEWMSALPKLIELPEAILVHGFLDPGKPLRSQEETVVVGVMGGQIYLERAYPRPWHELWDGPKPVVCGHQNYLKSGEPLVRPGKAYCIDTGCCRGMALTGLLLPGFELLSVQAARNHWEETARAYRHVFLSAVADDDLKWAEIHAALSGTQEPDRIASLRILLRRGRNDAERIVLHVKKVHAEIMARLREEDPEFDAHAPGEQARLYAAKAGHPPFIVLLHKERKGMLSTDATLAVLGTPRQLTELLERMDLVEPGLAEDDDGEEP